MTITAISLKQSSSASCVNINWSYPSEHVLQPYLLNPEVEGLLSDELDFFAEEFSEEPNDPLVSY